MIGPGRSLRSRTAGDAAQTSGASHGTRALTEQEEAATSCASLYSLCRELCVASAAPGSLDRWPEDIVSMLILLDLWKPGVSALFHFTDPQTELLPARGSLCKLKDNAAQYRETSSFRATTSSLTWSVCLSFWSDFVLHQVASEDKDKPHQSTVNKECDWQAINQKIFSYSFVRIFLFSLQFPAATVMPPGGGPWWCTTL